MTYELTYDQTVEKVLQKLPKEISSRIIIKLEASQDNPFLHFERMEGYKLFKLRVGKYRVIADIIKGKLLIRVIDIDKRGRIYNKY